MKMLYTALFFIAIIIFFILLPIEEKSIIDFDNSKIETQKEYKDSFNSKWRKSVDGLFFTVVGEKNGCSVNPDLIRYDYVSRYSKNVLLKNVFLGAEASDLVNDKVSGLINIYRVDSASGLREYIGERSSTDSYYVYAGFNYIFEFYECPVITDTKPLTTPDGYSNNDLVCDHGESISRVVCKADDDCSSYSYEEVFECQSGTYCTDDLNTCILSNSDLVRTTASGGTDINSKIETSTSEETLILYDNLITQLEGKTFDEKVINDKLDEQVEVLKEVKEQIIEDTNELENSENTPSSLILLYLIIFGGLSYGGYKIVRKRK